MAMINDLWHKHLTHAGPRAENSSSQSVIPLDDSFARALLRCYMSRSKLCELESSYHVLTL